MDDYMNTQSPEERARELNHRLKAGGFLWALAIEELTTLIQKADERDEAIKALNPCQIRGYFYACENCEPVMCCSGNECGCQGLPIDFKVTKNCGENCYGKLRSERDSYKQKAEALDWLDTNPNCDYIGISNDNEIENGNVEWSISRAGHINIGTGKTLLEAITAARKETEK